MKRREGRRNTTFFRNAALILVLAMFLGICQAWAYTKPGKPGKPDKPDLPGDTQVEIAVTSDHSSYLTPDTAKIKVEIKGQGKVDLYYKLLIPETSDSMPFVHYVNELYIPLAEDWEVQDTTLEYNIPLIALWPDGEYAFGVVATRPKVPPKAKIVAEDYAYFTVSDRRQDTFIQPGPDGVSFSVADVFRIDSQVHDGQIEGTILFQKPNGEEVWSAGFHGTYEYSLRQKQLVVTIEGDNGYHGGVLYLTMDDRVLTMTAETVMGRSMELSYNFADSSFYHNFEGVFDPRQVKDAVGFTLEQNDGRLVIGFEYERPNGRVISKEVIAYFDHEEGSTSFRIESASDPAKFIQVGVQVDEDSVSVEFEDGKGHKIGKSVEFSGTWPYDLDLDELYGSGVSLE